MKNILLIASVLASFGASAEMKHIPCEFSEIEGEKIRFLEVAPNVRFQNRELGEIYPYWVNDRFNPENIKVSDFSFRQAKLDVSKFYRRLEDSNVIGTDPSYVRYYKAVTEKCDTIWARIDEKNPEFSKYFDKSNHLMDGRIPWDKVDEILSVQFNDIHANLYAHTGKNLYIKSHASNMPLLGLSVDKMTEIEMDNHEEVKLLDVQPNSFVLKGVMTGTISLKVQRTDGSIVLLPWDPERVNYSNPLLEVEVRDIHRASISVDKIHFGMNYKEIIAAWGHPDSIRVNPLYDAGNGDDFFIQNDRYPYADSFNEFRVTKQETRAKSGEFQEWTYQNRLPEGKVLVLDDKGELHKRYQTRQLIRNEIHEDVALPKIK